MTERPSTERPSLLILSPLLAPIIPFLNGAYRAFAAWERPSAYDPASVRALVALGEAPLDKDLIETLPNLGLIACFSAGYDKIDTAWARGRGLALTHAPGVNNEDVADHALGLILASRRRIVEGDHEVREGRWSAGAERLVPSLKGRRLGIVGLGAIGEALAVRCAPLGLEIAWWGPRPKPAASWPRAETILDLAAWCDILAVACKVDQTNVGMISAEVIDAVGPEGLIVNVSRGQVIDEDSMIAALRSGRLGAAALDVFTQEPTPPDRWIGVPNTVLTPHCAGNTQESVMGMLRLLMLNLEAFFAGEPLKTPIRD